MTKAKAKVVEQSWIEADCNTQSGTGYWILLKPGFCFDQPGTHTVCFESPADRCDGIKTRVKVCDCKDCVRAIA